MSRGDFRYVSAQATLGVAFVRILRPAEPKPKVMATDADARDIWADEGVVYQRRELLTLEGEVWPWDEPTELKLDDDLVVQVWPTEADEDGGSIQPATPRRRYSVGIVTACRRRWGGSLSVPVDDPRIVEGLRARQALRAFL